MKENVLEFLKDGQRMTATLSQGRYISKVLELKEKNPEEVEIVKMPEKNDGYLVAHMPVKYLHLSSSRKTMTEEQKEQARERLALARKTKLGQE